MSPRILADQAGLYGIRFAPFTSAVRASRSVVDVSILTPSLSIRNLETFKFSIRRIRHHWTWGPNGWWGLANGESRNSPGRVAMGQSHHLNSSEAKMGLCLPPMPVFFFFWDRDITLGPVLPRATAPLRQPLLLSKQRRRNQLPLSTELSRPWLLFAVTETMARQLAQSTPLHQPILGDFPS